MKQWDDIKKKVPSTQSSQWLTPSPVDVIDFSTLKVCGYGFFLKLHSYTLCLKNTCKCLALLIRDSEDMIFFLYTGKML